MVAVQGVGAEGAGKPLGSRSSDVGCGSFALVHVLPLDVRCPSNNDRFGDLAKAARDVPACENPAWSVGSQWFDGKIVTSSIRPSMPNVLAVGS